MSADDLPEGRLTELVNLCIDRHGSRIAKVLYRRTAATGSP
jgi:hypothetical protein